MPSDNFLRVTIDGSATGLSPLSALVVKELGRIPMARIHFSEFLDNQSLDAATMPGKPLKVEAELNGAWHTLFTGVIAAHRLLLKNGERTVTVEARDKAAALTLSPRTRFFAEKTDGQICDAIAKEHGLAADTATASLKHEQMIQARITDWDFIQNRLWANGLIARVEDGKLSAIPPTPTGAALVVDAGSALELDATIDARAAASVQASAWDPATQKVVVKKESHTAPPIPGSMDRKKAGGVYGENVGLVAGAALPPDELAKWAGGIALRTDLSIASGRVRLAGCVAVPGAGMEIKNCSTLADGTALVWSVRHNIDDSGWQTEIEFGPERLEAAATLWSRPLPPLPGLWAGTVLALPDDPAKGERIKVELPGLTPAGKGLWARLASPQAGNKSGQVFRPDKGDEVFLGFLDADPRHPVVLAQAYSKAHPTPGPLNAKDDKNDLKGLITRSDIRVLVDDKDKIVTISTPGGNSVVLDDKAKKLVMKDGNGNTVTLASGGITLDSSKGKVTITGKTGVAISSSANVNAEGMQIGIKAKTTFKAEGAMAELNGSGVTTIKGGLVKIN